MDTKKTNITTKKTDQLHFSTESNKHVSTLIINTHLDKNIYGLKYFFFGAFDSILKILFDLDFRTKFSLHHSILTSDTN